VIDPTPLAVSRLKSKTMPKAVAEAEILMRDATRELRRPRTVNASGALLGVEDEGDRQTALALYATADKTVSSHAERMGSHLRSLA
jgi:hypothetical protein